MADAADRTLKSWTSLERTAAAGIATTMVSSRVAAGIKGALCLLAILFCVVSIALIYGEELERVRWSNAPSTLALYVTDELCRDAVSSKVLNCGPCGRCSNPHDIRIYRETRLTLTDIMTRCAAAEFLYGRDAGDSGACLVRESGLTAACAECWAEDYRCDQRHCWATCVKGRFLPFLPAWRRWDAGPLDHCLACDERFCGPDFLECAGANRHRVGVLSDIERDVEREVCAAKVDWHWILGAGKGERSMPQGRERETKKSCSPWRL